MAINLTNKTTLSYRRCMWVLSNETAAQGSTPVASVNRASAFGSVGQDSSMLVP